MFIKKINVEDKKKQEDYDYLKRKNLIRAGYKDIVFNDNVYAKNTKGTNNNGIAATKNMPDIPYLMAKDIYSKRALDEFYVYYNFKFL